MYVILTNITKLHISNLIKLVFSTIIFYLKAWAKKSKILSWKTMSCWQPSMLLINTTQLLLIAFKSFIRNALNIVKDDVIVNVDDLTGEIESVREELSAMQRSRTKLRQKISEVEEELKKTKEQVKQQSKLTTWQSHLFFYN